MAQIGNDVESARGLSHLTSYCVLTPRDLGLAELNTTEPLIALRIPRDKLIDFLKKCFVAFASCLLEKALAIEVVLEDRFAPVAAIHDMVDGSWD